MIPADSFSPCPSERAKVYTQLHYLVLLTNRIFISVSLSVLSSDSNKQGSAKRKKQDPDPAFFMLYT